MSHPPLELSTSTVHRTTMEKETFVIIVENGVRSFASNSIPSIEECRSKTEMMHAFMATCGHDVRSVEFIEDIYNLFTTFINPLQFTRYDLFRNMAVELSSKLEYRIEKVSNDSSYQVINQCLPVIFEDYDLFWLGGFKRMGREKSKQCSHLQLLGLAQNI